MAQMKAYLDIPMKNLALICEWGHLCDRFEKSFVFYHEKLPLGAWVQTPAFAHPQNRGIVLSVKFHSKASGACKILRKSKYTFG